MVLLRCLTIGCVVSLALSSAVTADILRIGDEPPRVLQDATHPARGMSMTEVVERYGEPRRRQGAVGEPPISRWNYPGYSVYFEHQYVLHTVEHSQETP